MVPLLSSSGVPADVVDELVSLYRSASVRLLSIVRHPPGSTSAARQFAAARASAQLAQVDRILAELRAGAAQWTGRALPRAVRDGIARGDQQAKDAGVKPSSSGLKGSFDLVASRPIQLLARDIIHDLDSAAKSMATTTQRILRKTAQQNLAESDIDRILAGGLIEGKPAATIRQLRDELRRVAGGNTVTVIDKNGTPIHFDAGYYAKLVATTKTREATVVARHERLREKGLDLVTVVGRVSRNFCTAYLGRVFSLSGKSDKYPALSSLPGGHGPPFHPQCSKSTTPFVASLSSEEEIRQSHSDSDDAKLRGVDATEAQRRFKDLQIYTQVRDRYTKTTKAA